MITPPATYWAGGVISSQPRCECKGDSLYRPFVARVRISRLSGHQDD